VGDGDGADDGQSEAVVVVDAGAVESLEGLEEAVDHSPVSRTANVALTSRVMARRRLSRLTYRRRTRRRVASVSPCWSAPVATTRRTPMVVRFARLIQPPGRDLGGPAARAASGGIQSLPSLPRSVVRRNQGHGQLSSLNPANRQAIGATDPGSPAHPAAHEGQDRRERKRSERVPRRDLLVTDLDLFLH
jgi:hypothetical protein